MLFGATWCAKKLVTGSTNGILALHSALCMHVRISQTYLNPHLECFLLSIDNAVFLPASRSSSVLPCACHNDRWARSGQ
jgi:hypothetical protein